MSEGIFQRVTDAWSIIAKRGAPTQTLGTSRTSGIVGGGEGAGTFDEPSSQINLTGTRRFAEYDRLLRDTAIIGAGIRLFLGLISNAVWSCNPPERLDESQKEQAQKYADQAYEMLFDMTTSWSAITRKTATFRLYGYTLQEWTAKRNPDGTIGIKDIEHRPQSTIVRWNRDEGGTVESVVQRANGRSEVTLPRSKVVYAVDDTLTDSPEGLGLFRHIAPTAARLELFLSLEEIGFTTDLRGIPIARAPLGEERAKAEAAGPKGTEARTRAEATRSALLQPLRDFLQKHQRNEKTGILLSSDTYSAVGVDKATTPSNVYKWALELLNGDSTSFPDMANAINRMNQEIARLMGVEHLLLGADGGGSLALARSKVGTFYLTVTSTLLDLLEIYDRDIIAPWAELNGIPDELRPEMGVNEISDRDLEQMVTILKDLATAGAPLMPDDPAVGEVYDLMGLTRPPEREDEADLALTGDDKRTAKQPKADPANNDMADNPEDEVAKARIMRSRRNQAKAALAKRRAA